MSSCLRGLTYTTSKTSIRKPRFNIRLFGHTHYVVHKSHRFNAELADKIKPLSYNGIPLETELAEEILADRSQAHSSGESFEHCVIVFNNDTRGNVLQSFANVVSNQFHEEYKKTDQFVVKAVGAVGNEISPEVEQLKIGHYWTDYDKSKAKNNFKENSFIEAVRYCRQSSLPDFSEGYNILLNGILKLLRLSEKSDENSRSYTSTTLRNHLIADDNWRGLREIIHLLLNNAKPLNLEYWESTCEVFTTMFDLQGASEKTRQYLEYTEETRTIETQDENTEEDSEAIVSLPGNMVRHSDGFFIHLSTIHGVKGETHDATLVMETRFRHYDMGQLLNHIAGLDVTRVTQITKIKFIRQLYVAASRPRHLLCLAIHADRIEEAQKNALITLGWKVIPL